MKRTTLFATLLIASVSTLSAQQGARLGSRQTISPLPKELTKDGKSYMVLVDIDSKTATGTIGLYDSFGPSGIKKSIPISVFQGYNYYYEKASGYTETVTTDGRYSYCFDNDNTYPTKADIEAYLTRRSNPIQFIVKEFTTVNGDVAYYLDPKSHVYGEYPNPEEEFWNYKEYGLQCPWNYYTIDSNNRLWRYSAIYTIENEAVKMTVESSLLIDRENTYSKSSDIEKYLKRDYLGNDVEDVVITITEFTTLNGDKAYYINSSDTDAMKDWFWKYDEYGTQYPSFYVATDENGYLIAYEADYKKDIDLTNATWTKDTEYGGSSNDSYYPNIGKYLYINVDQSFYPTPSVCISQNLFNKDDYWEYITFDIDYNPTYYSSWTDSEGVIRREVYLRPIFKGMKIMNELGTVLADIPTPDDKEQTNEIEIHAVCVLNGLVYITTSEQVTKGDNGKWYEGVYVIDPSTTSVKSSMRAPARMEIKSTVVDQGDRLNIQVSESGENDKVTISSMSGQVLQTSGINQDNPVSVNTGAMPKGIYNVTLRGQGNPTENQRIIVK